MKIGEGMMVLTPDDIADLVNQWLHEADILSQLEIPSTTAPGIAAVVAKAREVSALDKQLATEHRRMRARLGQ